MSTNDTMEKLKSLRDSIAKMKLEAREIALQNKASIIEDIKLQIELCDITAEELGFTSSHVVSEEKEQGSRKPATPKYRLNDTLWSGRGKKPKDIAEYLEKGGSLDDLLINKDVAEEEKED